MIISTILIIWIVGILLLLTEDLFKMYGGELIRDGIIFRAFGYSFWPVLVLIFIYVTIKIYIEEKRGDSQQ